MKFLTKFHPNSTGRIMKGDNPAIKNIKIPSRV